METNVLEIIYYIFLGLITSLGQVLLVGICLYYLIKKGAKADATLLLIGSSIMLLCGILSTVGALFARVWGTESYVTYTYSIQGISMLGSLLFVIGFFILIRKVIKPKVITQE